MPAWETTRMSPLDWQRRSAIVDDAAGNRRGRPAATCGRSATRAAAAISRPTTGAGDRPTRTVQTPGSRRSRGLFDASREDRRCGEPRPGRSLARQDCHVTSPRSNGPDRDRRRVILFALRARDRTRSPSRAGTPGSRKVAKESDSNHRVGIIGRARLPGGWAQRIIGEDPQDTGTRRAAGRSRILFVPGVRSSAGRRLFLTKMKRCIPFRHIDCRTLRAGEVTRKSVRNTPCGRQ